MFNRHFFIGLVGLLVLLAPAETLAFDGKRKGFILGGGIGVGVTSYGYESHYYREYSSSMSASEIAFATDLRIGYAPSDLVQVYGMSKVAWLISGGLTATGVAGPGVTYFFDPAAPSWFVTAGLGLSTWSKFIGTHFVGDRNSWYGFGLSVGAGYEFARHASIEGSLTWGNPKTEEHGVSKSVKPLSLRVTVNFLGY
jgi:hypothetical protein